MRTLSVALVLIGALGLSGQAFARDIHFAKHTVDDIKAICSKVGGR